MQLLNLLRVYITKHSRNKTFVVRSYLWKSFYSCMHQNFLILVMHCNRNFMEKHLLFKEKPQNPGHAFCPLNVLYHTVILIRGDQQKIN